MLGSSLYPPPPPPPPPPDPEHVVKGYRWPATRLTEADMERLCELRAQLGAPITQLLHEAVSAYHRLLLSETDEPRRSGMPPRSDNGHHRRRSG